MSPNIDPLLEDAAAQMEHMRARLEANDRWVEALRNIAETVLNETDLETAFDTIVRAAAAASRASTTMLFLPSVGGALTCEFAETDTGLPLVGAAFPDNVPTDPLSRAGQQQLRGRIFGDVPMELRFQPGTQSAMVLTFVFDGAIRAAILLISDKTRLPFSEDDMKSAATFALQVTVAMEAAASREAEERALLWQERNRISQDLHDLAVQQLFAVGMQLERVRADAESGALTPRRTSQDLSEAIAHLEDAVNQIRVVVHGLKANPGEQSFTDRLQEEASQARHVLGFAPSLLLELDDRIIQPNRENTQALLEELSHRVTEGIANNAIATVRESLSNTARHAAARSATVEVSVSGRGNTGELVVTVVDDGKGIDPSRERSSGLANMSVRARELGGSFAVSAGPRGRGTSLVWRVPLA